MSTKDSFIFSLTNKNDLQSAKIGYSNDGDAYSIGCFPFNGPRFGGGNDLAYDYNSWTSNPYSYPSIDISSNFNVDDYEVFQVVKKIKKNSLKKTEFNHIVQNLNSERKGKDKKNEDRSFDRGILIF
jgi:hypothetical protein